MFWLKVNDGADSHSGAGCCSRPPAVWRGLEHGRSQFSWTTMNDEDSALIISYERISAKIFSVTFRESLMSQNTEYFTSELVVVNFTTCIIWCLF